MRKEVRSVAKVKISKENKIKTPLVGNIMFVFLCIYALCLLFPYLFALITSFRTMGDISADILHVSSFTFDNFLKVFTEFNYPVTLSDGSAGAYFFDGLLVNTILFAVGGAFCAALIPCIVGYCCARYKYKFSTFIEMMVYVLMAVPIVGSTASEIQVTQKIGIYDSIPGMWFMKCSFIGMYFLLFHATFRTIPKDYEEAAYMDGAGPFAIFFKIMLPLGKSLFFTAFILQFVALWSDYSAPLYFMPSHPTLALSLLEFSKSSSTSTAMQLAACVLLCIPTVTVFTIFTDKFTTNMQAGGIKG